ncbi:MATE family efflux transporter [Rhizosaccharibacter radicis]|uniref:Multidrug-efflux transporter n=1 Tax=Rhizosaccharibacter radicis TaxID=2782605 RepID=A0ABT1W1L8_9PROT|nr:MATE family efflux transporter [Acetobacteraceae bacterium KSS12]
MMMRNECDALVRLAVPLIVAALAQMAMGLTDSILLGRLGSAALAAGGLAVNLFFTLVVIAQSVLSSASVLVAQARGAGRPEDSSAIYGTGLLLGALFSVPLMVLFAFAEPLMRLAGEPAALAHDVGRYLRILLWATPAFIGGTGLLRSLLPAVEGGTLLLRVTPPLAVLNGLVNYGLIFGRFGLPRMGFEGSATATLLTLWLGALLLFVLAQRGRRTRPFLSPLRIDRRLIAPLLRLGVPIGLTAAAEMLLFLVAGLAAGLLGTASLAAHQVVLSIATTTFMVPMSLGQAANVRTGMATGARDPSWQRRAGFAAIGIAAATMTGIGILLLLLPRTAVGIYLDLSAPDNAATVSVALKLLAIAACFQLVDGIQATAMGALRGLGDTTRPMLIATGGYWLVGAPLGVLLAFAAGMGARGLWLGLAAGLAVVALLTTLRFRRLTMPARTARILQPVQG